MNALDIAQTATDAWKGRALSAERRLAEALSIIDNAARETMLDQHPAHAIGLLREDEQRRLYNLLKGDAEC